MENKTPCTLDEKLELIKSGEKFYGFDWQQHKQEYLISDTADGVKIEKDKTR